MPSDPQCNPRHHITSIVNLSDLVRITGFNADVIKRRLVSLQPRIRGLDKVYDSREALPVIYNDPKRRLEEAKMVIAEAKAAEILGLLLPLKKVMERWENVLTTFRTKLLAIPSKVESRCHAGTPPVEVRSMIEDELDECLAEVSECPLPPRGTTVHDTPEDMGSDPDADADEPAEVGDGDDASEEAEGGDLLGLRHPSEDLIADPAEDLGEDDEDARQLD